MKISVIVTSFNHEKYIAQCLESILFQKGDFQMEVIIGDDCSTDNTRSIAEQFQEKHPSIVSLLPAGPNLGITKNLKRCLDACSGEYIAICEGDDYWTDTNKLEKQRLFLESHLDYSMCFSAIMIYFEDRNRFEPFHDQLSLTRDILTTEDLIEQNYIGNFSCCMYRSEIVRKLPEKIFEFFTVDWMFNLCCGELGKIGFLRDWMSVYRKHSTGAWAGRSELENLYQLLAVIDTYNEFLNYKYDVHFIKLKAKINYFINISEKHSKFNPIWNVIKSVLGPFVRGMWKAISFLGQQSNLVYQKSNRAMMLIWNNLLKPTLRPFARKLRGLKATLSLQSQLAFRKIRTRHTDLLILDTLFPHPLSPFRYQEFISYLDRFPSALVLTTGEHLPTPALKETRQIGEIINEFEMEQPEYSGRTIIISHNIEYYEARLAYIVFLYNVSVFLPALELKQIPFVFTLYPGGGFRLNVEESDKMLKRVISSPCFRKVIVTQKNTYDYLISKNFCKSEQIEFIYGVVTPLNLLKNRLPKKYFGYEKNTLDICFVAHKYMEAGIDKGYDVFIETAKKLVATHCNIHFHIVGDFTDADLPIQGLDGRITFYGPRKNKWLENFYIDKDIILSPNIPFKVMDGSFDGFPTASCTEAGLRKVAVFCTDELHLNVKFTSGEDLVIIPHDSDKIVQLLEFYYSNPAKLKKLAETGSEKFRTVYNYENQILPRIRIIEAELQGEANEIFSTPNLL